MYRCFTNHNDDKETYDKKIITINSNLFFSLALYIILFILFFLSSNFCILLLLYFEVEFFLCRNFHANIWRFFCCTIYLFIFGRYLFKSQCGIRIFFLLFAHLSCEKKNQQNCQFQNATDEIIWIFAIFVANSNEYFALVKLTYFVIIVAFTM